MQDLDQKWAALVEDWQSKNEELLRFPLFEGGWMRPDRQDEFDRLRAVAHAARERMKGFIAAHS